VLSNGDAMPPECSVAIVGAGLAGLELAGELVRHGMSGVLVLEAGDAHELRHANVAHAPDAAARAWLQPTTDEAFQRPWETLTPPHYAGAAGLRRRLGGRSLYWYGVILPIEPWALESWPAGVVADLTKSWAGGPSLYEGMDATLRRWRGYEPVTVVVEPVAGLGLHATPAAIRHVPGDPLRWYAYSPLDAWRDPVSGSPLVGSTGCHLATGVEVLEILHDDARCWGVRTRSRATGATRVVRADDVVLAAGTLESSRLAVQALAAHGALDKPRLTGLNDHLVQGFFARFTGNAAAELLERLPPGNRFAPGDVRSNVYVETVELGNGEALLDVRSSGEQLPSHDSYVECRTTGDAPWPYHVHAAVSAADREVLAAQRDVLRRIWDDLSPCGRALHFDDFDTPARTNEAVLPEHIGAAPPGTAVTWASVLGSEDHEGGTLPLGGLLTDAHEFAALPHLYALGPATFPRAGAANPGLTVLALAHRLAAILADPLPARLDEVTVGGGPGRSRPWTRSR
jgi:choline dehydrogenase-like flavoprotein